MRKKDRKTLLHGQSSGCGSLSCYEKGFTYVQKCDMQNTYIPQLHA